MKKIIVIIIIISLLSICGCWDRIEPEKKAIVVGGGFDYDLEKDMYKIIFQIISPLNMTGSGQGGGSDKPNFWTVSAWGHSPYDAIANINKKVSRKISFSHAQIYLFSKRMAETKGILPIINAVSRSRQSRRIITLGVVKGDVEKILSVKIPIESSNVIALTRQIKLTMKEMGGITIETVRDFMTRLVQPGIEPYMVGLEMIEDSLGENNEEKSSPDKDPVIRVTGKYMFKDDKLVGFLDDRETRGCNWLVGKVRSGTLVLHYPGKVENKVDVIATQGTSEIKPSFKNGQPMINIKIKASGRIVNITGLSEIKDESKITESLNKQMDQVIKNDIKMAIKKAQICETDVFGFGFAFYRLLPDKWDQMKDDWDSFFSTLPVEIEVEANIERAGLVNRGPDIQ